MYADIRNVWTGITKKNRKIKELSINHMNRAQASGRGLAERNISLNNEYTGG